MASRPVEPHTSLARRILAGYALSNLHLTLVRRTWNHIYRVDSNQGCFALRIHRPGARDLLAIRSELVWLDTLHRDTDLVVPEPIPNAAGDWITTIGPPESPDTHHAVLFRWIEGRRPPQPLSLRSARRMGTTLARLHDHADRFHPPPEFSTARWDRVWEFGDPAEIYRDAPHPVLTPHSRARLRAAAERVQASIDALHADPTALRFLHIDLHPNNVKLQHGSMAILDFDDSIWCHPLQDLAVSLYALLRRDRSEQLRDAFLAGYTDVRPLPIGWQAHLEYMIDARLLDMIALNLRHPQLLSQASLRATLTWANGRLR